MFDSPLLLSTTNPHKVAELTRLLARHQLAARSAAAARIELPPIREDGATAAENARRKAVGTARLLGCWTLADDTVLEVDALDGQPGVYSARYAGPDADMAANRRKLLDQLAVVPSSHRGARFVCHLCLADPSGAVLFEVAGLCRGEILQRPRGERGFGYDSLFFLPDVGTTLAELDSEQSDQVTHRARAVSRLAEELRRSDRGPG